MAGQLPVNPLAIRGKVLGYSFAIERLKKMELFHQVFDDHFIWLTEVVVEAKKAFASPEIQLLPKTPSAKRCRAIRSDQTDSTQDEEESLPPRKTRRTKTTKKDTKKKGKIAKDGLETSEASIIEISTDDNTADESTAGSKRGRPRKNNATAKPTRASRSSKRNAKKQQEEEEQAPPPIKEEPTPMEEEEEQAPPTPVLSLALDSPQLKHTPDACTSQLNSSRSNRLNGSTTGSPRSIPGFHMLHHVKQKARAYESYVHKSNDELSADSESVSCSPSPVRTPESKNRPPKISITQTNSPTPATPPTVVHKSRATLVLSQEQQPLSPNSRCNISINKTPTCSRSEVPKGGAKRRSSARRSVRGSLTGVRKSLSKRRSSVLRQKAHSGITTIKQQEKQKGNSSPALSHQKLHLLKPAGKEGTSGEEATSSSESTDLPKKTRSKMRAPRTVPACSEDVVVLESTPDEAHNRKASPKRTRSKMRVNKPPPALPMSGTESEPDTPKKKTPRICHASSSAEENSPARPNSIMMNKGGFKTPTAAPCRSTRSKMRKFQEMDTRSPNLSSTGIRGGQPVSKRTPVTVKRTRSGSKSYRSPSKGISTEDEATHSDDVIEIDSGSDEDLVDRTPSPQCPKNKVVRPIHPSSFLNSKAKNLPTNEAGQVMSFIPQDTSKKVSQKDKLAQKRMEVLKRQREIKNRLDKRAEQMNKKAEEQRKRNDERLAAAACRREEMQKKQREQQKDLVSHTDKGKNMASQVLEDKQRQEREKQKLRDKRKAEAEVRRKQEEEARLQKLKELEEEKRRHEEYMGRKRAEEEAERQRKVEAARRAEEERKAALERRQRTEQERLRKAEEMRLREEEERQRLREEREKRERAERERAELERQQEKERKRKEELEREKELERQCIAEERNKQEVERKAAEEERRIQATISKHNHALQHNTSLNTSTPSLPHKPNFNTTITKPRNPDSYEMTPQRKYIMDNYDINDIKSDDSTDDEEAPRKPIPTWATGNTLKALIISQTYHPPDLDKLFDIIEPLDLAALFKKNKARFHKRTSSAVWDSPILKPSGKH